MPEINFFWDPLSDNILQERDETGAVTAEYTAEPGLYGNIISQNRGGVESQFHYDAQGSTLAVTDDDQNVTDTFAYTAFGEVTERTGTTEVPFQYIGQKGYYTDGLTGQIVARRRPYEPVQGRWGSVDPRGQSVDDVNTYAYVRNNALNRIDPSGEFTLEDAYDSRCGSDFICRFTLSKAALYRAWLALESSSTAWTKGLPNCPCTITCIDVRYCTLLFGDYNATLCTHNGKGQYAGFDKPHPPTLRDRYHPGACYEIRWAGTPSGQQCTYDKFGNLITGGFAAGSPDRVSPGSSTFDHYREDVEPFELALELDGGTWGPNVLAYLAARPSNNGNGCPANAISAGGPGINDTCTGETWF